MLLIIFIWNFACVFNYFVLDLYTHEKDNSYFLYSVIDVGEPTKTIFAEISSDSYGVRLYNNECNVDVSESKYDVRSSKSLNIFPSERRMYDNDKEIFFAREIIYFKNENNKKFGVDLNLIYAANKRESSKNTCAVFGLKLSDNNNILYGNNIINQLREHKLIKSHNWFIVFKEQNKYGIKKDPTTTSNASAQFYIGLEPHDIFVSYDPNNLVYVSSNFGASRHGWDLLFEEIFYYEKGDKVKINKGDVFGSLVFDDKYLTAPREYMAEIEQKCFKEYFRSDRCFNSIINNYYYIICNSLNLDLNKFYSEFSTLHFFNKQLNFTFELTGKELFTPNNTDLIFNLRFSSGLNHWKIGSIFLKKYLFTFNSDNKMIGFYNDEYFYSREITTGNNSFFGCFVYCTMFLTAAFITGVFVSKTIYKKRKKANEIDEDFGYDTNENICGKCKASEVEDLEMQNKLIN